MIQRWNTDAALRALCVMALLVVPARSALAQGSNVAVRGDLSILAATFPKQDDVGELRSRVRLDVTADPSPWLRLRVEGLAEGLASNRASANSDGLLRIREAWAEVTTAKMDLRAGYGRLVWGRLDEIMPSDVINPIDTAAFFLEGRSEARLPIPFLRSRIYLPASTRLELIAALPGRRGRFDLLNESSSPFNLVNDAVFPAGVTVAQGVRRLEPGATWRNLEGGARLSTTVERVDLSVSVFRGFESFGLLAFETRVEPVLMSGEEGAVPSVVGELVERYPRFTMVATDAEMVVGPWAIRGEVAGFVDKSIAGAQGPVPARVFDAGIGVDRSAGAYRVFGSVVWHREWAPTTSSLTRSDVNVIGSVERRFSRDRHLVRVFGVANPDDRSGFVRGVWSWSVRDNLSFDASGGVFLGTGTDSIGRFTGRDFAFVRVRYLF